MRLLVVIAPDQFRDEELFEPVALFRRKGIEYDIASVRRGTCRGMLGGSAEATLSLAEAAPEHYDGIVVVGGIGSERYLWSNPELHALLRRFQADGKVVAAICLSPVALGKAGVLKGKRATVFRTPASVSELKACGALLAEGDVVADGTVVTANGPSAARRFAEEIVKRLGA